MIKWRSNQSSIWYHADIDQDEIDYDDDNHDDINDDIYDDSDDDNVDSRL